ncbi:hypothetical protein BMT54_04325 [Pasteurellaceae bacterium 15-036681]|nr:hypothetical protein BMT54_04325 [Pasteurellaceae bacterium 15-036681]
MLKSWLLFLVCTILSACSSPLKIQQLPIQTAESQTFKVEQLTATQHVQQASLLTVQYEQQQWRWVQTDPLGAPIARLLLTKDGWQNDGFVMPNNQAKQLYSALATALNPKQPLFEFSQIQNENGAQHFYINHKKVWAIKQQNNLFKIDLSDQSQWQIEQLEQ